MWTTLLLSSFRHHLQLDSYLHPSHQQRLEPHPVHLDYQLLQRAGGTLTLSLAEKTHLEKRPQKPHLLHNLHGDATGSLLQATSLPPAGVPERGRSPLRLRRQDLGAALCKLGVEGLLMVIYLGSYMTVALVCFNETGFQVEQANNH